jgi:chemotaxis protein MotB
VRVIGHTDGRAFARPAGKNNWDLSYERADAARRVLQGSPTPPKIECVAAYGDTQLRDAANPYAAENRRLALLILRGAEAETHTAKPRQPGAPGAEKPADAAKPAASPPAPVESDSWLIGSDHAKKP